MIVQIYKLIVAILLLTLLIPVSLLAAKEENRVAFIGYLYIVGVLTLGVVSQFV